MYLLTNKKNIYFFEKKTYDLNSFLVELKIQSALTVKNHQQVFNETYCILHVKLNIM